MDGLIHLVKTAYEPPIRAAAMRELLVSGAAEANATAVAQLTEEEFATDDAVLAELMECSTDLLLPIALKTLDDPDPDVRWRTFTTLVRPERALEFTRLVDGQALIIATLCDDDWRMRVHAVSILGKCADQAWARKFLRNACESLDDRVKVRAIDALGSSKGSQKEAVIFKTHFSDPSDRVRIAAFRALGHQGLFEDEILRQALLDPYPPLQHAALMALLSSAPNIYSHSLLSLAEQISSQSSEIEIFELGTELRLRLSQ
jgi:HEAT repeat protein